MTDYSFGERLIKIFELITSSTFFISLLVIIVLTIIILVINSKVKSKVPRYLAAFAYILIMVYVLVKYGAYVLSLNDSLVEKLFKAMYFPNLITYVCMLIITIFILIITFINKKYSIVLKIGNILCFCLIWFFFILILDTVKSAGINIYETTEVYSNEALMILLQASMYIFFIWMGILLIDLIVKKILAALEKRKEMIESGKIVPLETDEKFEEVRQLSDEEFRQGYLMQNKLKKDEQIKEILKHKSIDM